MTTTLKEVIREHVLRVLEHHNWNRVKAAKALGISIRTLRIYLSRYREQGFEIPESGYGSAAQQAATEKMRAAEREARIAEYYRKNPTHRV